MIRLSALGALNLTGSKEDEVAAVLSQPKRAVLLVYLAVARPRGFHTRDKLLGLFWPERDWKQARGALRTALHFLRKTLKDDLIRSRGSQDVGLNREHLWCDVLAFEQAVEQQAWEDALELYRGDALDGLFLSGCPEFERWLGEERERLRGMAAGAAWNLAHRQIQQGKLVDAERAARRALALAGTDESVVRDFIVDLTEAGGRATAVRFYQKSVEGLKRDLDLSPATETHELVEKIRTSTD